MKTYLLWLVLILSLTACEYHEMTEVEIQGTKYTFNENQVTAMYQTVGSQTTSLVIADDGTTALTFTIKNNIKGTYTCANGSGAQATIFITYDGTQFSTQFAGSSGVIDLVTAGANLIEGTFNGNIKNSDGTYTISVTNGKFSGRAY
jgi:ABC-type dipeptide/oligopeptide/nickel transport system ATPase component